MLYGHDVAMGEVPAGPIGSVVVPINGPHGELPLGYLQLDRELGLRRIKRVDIGNEGPGDVEARLAVGHAAYDHAPGTGAPDWRLFKPHESRLGARSQPAVVLWDEQTGFGKAWWGDFGQSASGLLELVFAEVKRQYLWWQRLPLARVSLVVASENDHHVQYLSELMAQTVPGTQLQSYFAESAVDASERCERLLGAGVEPVLLVREQIQGEHGDIAPTNASTRHLIAAVRLRVRFIAWQPIDSPHEVPAPPWARGCAQFWPFGTDYQLIGAVLDVAGVPRETADE